jgi:hypothetical protein
MLIIGSAVPAYAEGADTVTVPGTYREIAVDGLDPAHPLSNKSMITVGDATVQVSEHIADGLSSGQSVEVEVEAPTGVDTHAEVATALAAGEAEIVDASPANTAAVAATTTAATTALGSHSLTVIPVYWTKPDRQTKTSLTALAKKVGAYWSGQSRGLIQVPTVTVKSWTKVSALQNCDDFDAIAALHDRARWAAGVPLPTSTRHVLVYFPDDTRCQWAGLADVGGGAIWINGYAYPDGWEHEFGHNLGLGHSGSEVCWDGDDPVTLSGDCDEYPYDDFDVMGYARYGEGYSLNAAHADQLGILNGVRTPSIGSLFSVPAITSSSANRAVRVDLANTSLYVEYRPRSGRNAGEPSSWAGVQVRQVGPATADQSFLVAAVPAADPAHASPAKWLNRPWAIPGTNLVMVVEYVDSGKARIRFRDVAATTPPSAPQVLSPAPATLLKSGRATLTWAPSNPGGAALTRYEIRVNGNNVAYADAGATEASVPMPDGARTLTVAAVDADGMASTSTGVRVTVDAHAPTVAAPVVRLRRASTAHGVPVTISTSASDGGTGVCALAIRVNGRTIKSAKATRLSVDTTLRNARTANVTATATDCAKRVTSRAAFSTARSAGNTKGAFRGHWSTVHSSAMAGGSARVTRTGGASATWTFAGSQVGWVGSQRSWTGTATMYIDGKYVGKVDTRGQWTNRRLLWTRSVKSGRHRLTVVVTGSKGRPTVFQDGFVSLR